eukprot:scaffold481176_cov45-Prasinocladus_malaysianus.AAC.1
MATAIACFERREENMVGAGDATHSEFSHVLQQLVAAEACDLVRSAPQTLSHNRHTDACCGD